MRRKDTKHVFRLCLLLSFTIYGFMMVVRAGIGLASSRAIGLEEHIKRDGRIWRAVLEHAEVDGIPIPEYTTPADLWAWAIEMGYVADEVAPPLRDPWGHLYHLQIGHGKIHLISSGPDGTFESSDDISVSWPFFAQSDHHPDQPASPHHTNNTLPLPYVPTCASGTCLGVTKSGHDIILSWTGTGTSYDGTKSPDVKFYNAELLFQNYTGTTWTYQNALTNGIDIEYFDVTNETETNRGVDGNGLLPPPPPQVTSLSGTLYIGGPASLTGSGFSDVPGDNLICFSGGVCIHPDTATTTQLDFTVPPSALSGPLSVTIGQQTSEPMEVSVYLENPANGWLIRSLAYAEGTGEYWGAGRTDTNRVLRLYYDSTSKTWVKEDRSGGYAGNILYCSTVPDRAGRLHCGLVTLSSGGGGTRVVQTNPPGVVNNCLTLFAGSGSAKVPGAADDPNPNGVTGRDVVYFAYNNTSTGAKYIVKVASDCSQVLDSDYGNQNGSWNFGPKVGMAVDPATGDLYVASNTTIYVVHPDETVETVKSGFSRIYGLAIDHPESPGYGVLLVADSLTGSVQWLPMDNPSLPVLSLEPASSLRTVLFANTPFDPESRDISKLNRIHPAWNDANLIRIHEHPGIVIPKTHFSKAWISSYYGGGDRPPFQAHVRSAQYPQDVNDFSVIQFRGYWQDNNPSREMCVALGDPRSRARYESLSSNPGCGHPWFDPKTGNTNGICDNKDPFVNGQVGAPAYDPPDPINPFMICQTGCTQQSPCTFSFKITQYAAGDNYQGFFYVPSRRKALHGAVFNAWKRVFLEVDRMCKKGGVLDSYAGTVVNTDTVYLRLWDQTITDPTTVSYLPQVNDYVRVFDSIHPFEDQPSRQVVSSSIVQVCQNSICRNALKLVLNQPTPQGEDFVPSPDDFSSGRSAGVCVYQNGDGTPGEYWWPKTDELRQALRDIFVSYRIARSVNGSQVVPLIPENGFVYLEQSVSGGQTNWFRYQQHWFQHRTSQPSSSSPSNDPTNFWHLVGVDFLNGIDLGKALASANAAFIAVGHASNEWSHCYFDPPINRACTQQEKLNAIRQVTTHEVIHLFAIGDEPGWDWGWCGDPNPQPGEPPYTCHHPNPPDPSLQGQYCVLYNPTYLAHNENIQMETSGVLRMDCFLMMGQACHTGDFTGRPNVRYQSDPQ